MYDVIPQPPDEPETPDEYEERDRIRDQIGDAVDDVLTVDEWHTLDGMPIGHARQIVTATIPFRVTGYRHDVDDDAPDGARRRYDTDGWVDFGDPPKTYITKTFNHQYQTQTDGPDEPPDNADQILNLQADALASNVYAALRDGTIERTITHEVETTVEDDVEPPRFVDRDEILNEEQTFEITTEEVDVGTATHRVDAVIPPEAFFGET